MSLDTLKKAAKTFKNTNKRTMSPEELENYKTNVVDFLNGYFDLMLANASPAELGSYMESASLNGLVDLLTEADRLHKAVDLCLKIHLTKNPVETLRIFAGIIEKGTKKKEEPEDSSSDKEPVSTD